jgi:uncharacterized protein (TIGR02217 family)
MTYLTTEFPKAISHGAVGGPGWGTTTVITSGGYRYSNQGSEQALCRYDVSHAARSATIFAQLLDFFRACRGPLHSFPFRDFSDYQATATQGDFVALGGTQYQMVKKYSAGGVTHSRTILKPISGTVTVTGGTGVSVDYATGLVTSTGAPTSWAGEFYVPCHFEVDEFRGEILETSPANRHFGWNGILIVETRNP